VLALAGGWLAYDRVYARGGDRAVAWEDVTPRDATARFARPTERVIESAGELRALVRATPSIDFTTRRAALVALGPRSSSGYAVEVEAVREERRRIVVAVRERSPALADAVAPRVTYPFRLIALPRGDKPVEIER
jgi:hypothetical protein